MSELLDHLGRLGHLGPLGRIGDVLASLASSAWLRPFIPLIAAAASFVTLAVVFWPLERLFPARSGQRLIRPAWWTDLAFFSGQYLLWSGIALWVLGHVQAGLEPIVPASLRAGFAGLPLAAQALIVILLGDVAVYWFHRACHAVPILWRIHAVHHSAEHLDWLAAHREHPIDGLLTQLSVNAPAIVLGFSIAHVAWIAALRGMWAIFIHSNVRLPLGPLRYVLGAPELHHWHHLRSDRAMNYANVAPWTDLLFGTFFLPRLDEPEAWPLGTDPPLVRGYLAMLWRPLVPSRARSDRSARVVPLP